MRKMCMLLSFCLATGVAGRAAGQTETGDVEGAKKDSTPNKAVEILEKVDAAAKAVKLVQYKATVIVTRGSEERSRVEGTAVIAGDCPGGRPDKFLFKAKFTLPDSTETKEVTAGSDADVSFLIDPSVKTVYADIDPAVLGGDGGTAARLAMIEYCYPTPFRDEINAERTELKGTTKVGDEDCYEIDVKYATANQEATWFFSKKDFLPRQVIRRYSNPAGQITTTKFTLTDVVVDPKLKHDPFKLVVPEGFTKTDEFAPARRRGPR